MYVAITSCVVGTGFNPSCPYTLFSLLGMVDGIEPKLVVRITDMTIPTRTVIILLLGKLYLCCGCIIKNNSLVVEKSFANILAK